MDRNREALLRIYHAAKKAKEYSDLFAGYSTPYTEIYEEIADAMYYLLGENTETFDLSTTYFVLNNKYLDEETAVGMLISLYERKSTVKPHTFSKEEMAEMYRRNGGYIHTPEGEWK